MSILKYFGWKRKDTLSLPDPKGPSKGILPATIVEVNKEVLKVLNDTHRTKRDTCIKNAPDCKAKIATKYALENGNCAAARKYSSQLKEKLTESTAHSWVTKFKQE